MDNQRYKLNGMFQIQSLKLLGILVISLFAAIIMGYTVGYKGYWWLIIILAAILPLVGILTKPDFAVLLLTFALYTNIPVVLSTFHGVPQIIAASFFLILAVPLAEYVIFRRQPVVFTPAFPLILVYLTVMLISTMVSQSYDVSIENITNFIIEGLILYILVSNVIRSTRILRWVIWVLILAGALMGALSIYQELTHTYSNNYGGFAQVSMAGFKVGEDLFGKVIRPRLAGPIGEKNRYAQILLVVFPLALFRFWGEKSLWLRICAAIGVFFILGATLLTFSRGAMVALLGLLIIMIILRYIRWYQVVLLLLIFVGLISIVAPDTVTRLNSFQGIGGLFSDSAEDPDGAILGRVTENLSAFYTFADHPVIGVGPGEFFKNYSRQMANELNLRILETNRRAHNMYLEIAADLGFAGLISFLAIVWVTLTNLWRLRRYWEIRNPELSNMATGILLGVMAYMATAVFLHLSYQRYYWFMLAFANAAIYVLQKEMTLDKNSNTNMDLVKIKEKKT